jgi:hypothetical protein
MLYYKTMDKWIMCVVFLIVGMLMFHLLKGVCGCNTVEGNIKDDKQEHYAYIISQREPKQFYDSTSTDIDIKDAECFNLGEIGSPSEKLRTAFNLLLKNGPVNPIKSHPGGVCRFPSSGEYEYCYQLTKQSRCENYIAVSDGAYNCKWNASGKGKCENPLAGKCYQNLAYEYSIMPGLDLNMKHCMNSEDEGVLDKVDKILQTDDSKGSSQPVNNPPCTKLLNNNCSDSKPPTVKRGSCFLCAYANDKNNVCKDNDLENFCAPTNNPNK